MCAIHLIDDLIEPILCSH